MNTDTEENKRKEERGQKIKAISRLIWFIADAFIIVLRISGFIQPLQALIFLLIFTIPLAIIHLIYIDWNKPPTDLY